MNKHKNHFHHRQLFSVSFSNASSFDGYEKDTERCEVGEDDHRGVEVAGGRGTGWSNARKLLPMRT